MTKSLVITLLSSLLLTGCNITGQPSEPLLLEGEAIQIAESECIKDGESIEPGYYNESSKTWWFDANLNSTKEGCNPACVVSEDGSVEINWRCTGLILE